MAVHTVEILYDRSIDIFSEHIDRFIKLSIICLCLLSTLNVRTSLKTLHLECSASKPRCHALCTFGHGRLNLGPCGYKYIYTLTAHTDTVHTATQAHLAARAGTHTHTYTHAHTHTHTHTNSRVHTYSNTHSHARTHTGTHMHAHIHARMDVS